MPKFRLNKLVRDKLRDEYTSLNQKASYRQLTTAEHGEALKHKIIEEVNEISLDASSEAIASELADVQQVLQDLMDAYGILASDVEELRKKKFDKKGGFSEATFVETLELESSDEWVEYYRKDPERFKEEA